MVTVSTIGKEHPRVKVYDSMYSTASTDLQEQVASILSTLCMHACSAIILDFINVPLQSGSFDCCLYNYAIANAIAFVMGKNPGSTDEKSHNAVPREPEHDLISSDFQ